MQKVNVEHKIFTNLYGFVCVCVFFFFSKSKQIFHSPAMTCP